MANSIFGTNKSTLGRNPYYSRFTDFEKTSNNYNLIGFTPGLALQAAELNELQDNQIKNDTLSNTLWANWMPYLLTRSTNFITGLAIDSVFWDGTIPISPDLVEYSGRFTFNIGWYYYRHTSGLRYWIHLNETISLDQDITINGYVRVNSNFTDVFSSNDSRLYDNSSGSINNTSPGSYRINMEITSFDFVAGSTPENYILRFYNTIGTSKILWGNNIDTGFN